MSKLHKDLVLCSKKYGEQLLAAYMQGKAKEKAVVWSQQSPELQQIDGQWEQQLEAGHAVIRNMTTNSW